jgi:hypothetical protein
VGQPPAHAKPTTGSPPNWPTYASLLGRPPGHFPEITTALAHLRHVLGDQTYESLARRGETMTTVEMATYAYDQIDQARAELNAVSK